jgi:hypothetical protein
MKLPISTGYWIFSCRPSDYEIEKFLQNSNEGPFTVASQFLDLIRPGQKGILRIRKDTRPPEDLITRTKLISGIYASVEVKSKPYLRKDAPSSMWLKNINFRQIYFIDLHYENILLDDPITLKDIKNDSILNSEESLKSSIVSVPLTKGSYLRIMEIIKKRTIVA